MNRKEFLNQLGLGAAFVLTATCMGSCTKDEVTTPTPSTGGAVDFTIDLTDAKFADLQTNGGYVVENDVVIARKLDGDYAAATVVCSHEGFKRVRYNDDEWQCTQHGARFDLQGNGLNANGSKGLTIFKVALNGDELRVFA